MRLTLWTLSAAATISLLGCTGRDTNRDAGTTSRSTETGAASDTGLAAPSPEPQPSATPPTDTAPTDTTVNAPTGDTSGSTRQGKPGNQTKSGVTNTETGKSTLGPGVTQTRPDQNQPVTSKGDTLRHGHDSTNR